MTETITVTRPIKNPTAQQVAVPEPGLETDLPKLNPGQDPDDPADDYFEWGDGYTVPANDPRYGRGDIQADGGVAETITAMDNGKIIAEGSPAEIERNREVQKAYLGN